MSRRAKVVVVGSSNTDMVVRTPHIPAPGETVLGGDFMIVSGGKGANQAVAASRLGGDVAFVARVGRDVFGDRAVASIGAAGVITRYIARDERTPSGVALICVAESGQNAIVVASGANAQLSPADVEAANQAFTEADAVVVQFETPLETVAHVIALAKQSAKRVILNPAPAQSLPSGFLNGVDVITPNEIEAAMLLGWSPDAPFDASEAAVQLRQLGVGTAIITIGEGGAVVADAEGVRQIPGYLVQALDTTAAGDCFTGALTVALGEGEAIGVAVAFANAAAALSVTRLGAQTSIPTRADVEKFLAAQ